MDFSPKELCRKRPADLVEQDDVEADYKKRPKIERRSQSETSDEFVPGEQNSNILIGVHN